MSKCCAVHHRLRHVFAGPDSVMIRVSLFAIAAKWSRAQVRDYENYESIVCRDIIELKNERRHPLGPRPSQIMEMSRHVDESSSRISTRRKLTRSTTSVVTRTSTPPSCSTGLHLSYIPSSPSLPPRLSFPYSCISSRISYLRLVFHVHIPLLMLPLSLSFLLFF